MTNALVLSEPAYTVVCDTDDEEEWLAVRRTGLGASEIGGVLGMGGRRSSPFKVFFEKVGAVEPEDLSDIEAVDWGHTMEPVIARKYAQRTGRPIDAGRKHRFQVLRSNAHPWALCSLDYWTADNDGAPLRPLEIKNVSAFMAEDWLNGTPDYYYAQLQQQILVTGAQRATSAACLGGNRLIWCDVERDDQLIRRIVFQGQLMWERIQQRMPPDPDGSEATKEVLKRLFPADDGSVVTLPMALAEKIDEWRQLKADVKSTLKRVDLLEAEIKSTLGTAQRGVLPTGDEVRWKSYEKREYVVAAQTVRPLTYHPSKGT